MFKVGDLVYVKKIKNLYWAAYAHRPGLVVEIGPHPNVLTINIDGKNLAVVKDWVEKRTMEEK